MRASTSRTAARRVQKAVHGGANLTEVARLARVSTATVSRVMNSPGMVAPETAKRVLEIIRKTGYVPNLLAGGLASNRSRLVAAVVPTIARSIFNETIEAMTEELGRANYQVMLAISGESDQRMAGVIDSVLSRRPEAVIMTGLIGHASLRQKLASTGATIIETWTLTKNPVDVAVGFSHQAVGEAVAQAFYDLGRRRPFVISANSPRSLARQKAFVSAMAALGVRKCATRAMPLPTSFTQGRQALAELLDSGGAADCVFCGSDWQAHGVIVEAQLRGLRVPQDIAVFGFGNMDFAESTEPSLSTVHIDGGDIGRIAAQFLIKRAEGQPVGKRVIDVGFTLIRRASA